MSLVNALRLAAVLLVGVFLFEWFGRETKMLGPLVFAAIMAGLSFAFTWSPRLVAGVVIAVAAVSIVGGIAMWRGGALPWFAPVFDVLVFGTCAWLAVGVLRRSSST